MSLIMSLDAIPDQLMQIQFIDDTTIIEIYKTTNALHFQVFRKNEDEDQTKKYIMHLPQESLMTVQEVFDHLFEEVMPFMCYDKSRLKLKLTAFEILPDNSELAISSKEILESPIRQTPLSVGKIIYRTTLHECGNCLKKSALITKKCGYCNVVYYCDRNCQRQDWLIRHKEVCHSYYA
jgi:hypothetical protein